MNTLQKKYKSIKVDKLPAKLKKTLQTLKEKSNNFESDDDKLMKVAERSLDKVIAGLKVKRPELLKKVKGDAKKPDTSAPKGEPDPDDTLKERTDKIKKENETNKEAEERAREQKEKEEEEREDVEETADSLEKLIKDFPKLKGFNADATSVKRDAGRKAKTRGKRVSRKGWKNQYGASKGGRTYYENRENRSDRLAPNYPSGAPKLEKGGKLKDFKVGDKVEFKAPYFESNLTYKGKVKELTNLGAKVEYKNDSNQTVTTTKPYKNLIKLEKGGKIKAPNYDVVVQWVKGAPMELVNSEALTKLEADKVSEAFAKSNKDFYKLIVEPALPFEKGGKIDASYVPNYEIISVTTKDGKVIDYTEDYEILSGLHVSDKKVRKNRVDGTQLSLLEKGGKLPKNAVYIPNHNIDFVETDDGVVQGDNLYNGIWFHSEKQTKLIDEAVKQGRFKKVNLKTVANTLNRKLPKDVVAEMSQSEIVGSKKKVYGGFLFYKINGKKHLLKAFVFSYDSPQDVIKSMKSYLRTVRFLKNYDGGSVHTVWISDRNDSSITFRFKSKSEADKFEKIVKSIEKKKFEKGGETEKREVVKSEPLPDKNKLKKEKEERQKRLAETAKKHRSKKKEKLLAEGGYCKRRIYKYGGETGRDVFIVNEGVTFDRDKYKAVFEDYDKDGRSNIDDKDPLNKENQGQVEQVELRKSFEKLLDVKDNLDSTMDEVIKDMDEKAPKDAKIYARTKTPYSIIKKLIDKRLLDPKRGLTDLVGTTLVVANRSDLEKIRKTIESGTFGEVVDFDDYYTNPLGGYTAYHYVVMNNGVPVEIQAKTERVKKLNEISHEFYKKGTLSPEGNLKVSRLIEKADKGDKEAQKEVEELFDNQSRLKDMITTDKKEKGGKVGGQTRFIGMIDGKKHVVNADNLLDAKNKLIDKLNLSKKKQSYLSVMSDKAMKNQEFRFFEKGGKTKRPKSATNRDRKYLNVEEDYEVRYANKKAKKRQRYNKLSEMAEKSRKRKMAKGGKTKRPKSATNRDRKYLNPNESWEVAYAKGKNRKQYKMAKGGEVIFVDTKDPKERARIWESKKSHNDKDAIGSFAHRLNGKYLGDYYIYKLDDFDEKEFDYIPLKENEILARVETDNMVHNEMPLVKINIDKGYVYFMVEDVDDNDIKFERASADVIYLSLNKNVKDYAKTRKTTKPLPKPKKLETGGGLKDKNPTRVKDSDLYGEELMEIMEDIDQDKKAKKVVPKTDKKEKGGNVSNTYTSIPKDRDFIYPKEVSPKLYDGKSKTGLFSKFVKLVWDKDKHKGWIKAQKAYKQDYYDWCKRIGI